MECLFCRGSGPFNTKEHIVPESLGNDTDVLVNMVCDRCQNYFSHSVEKPVLESTPIGFWRTYLGVLSKRKKLSRFSSSPPNRGRMPSQHPASDHFEIIAEEDFTTTLKIGSEIKEAISRGNRDSLQIVLSPWHLSIMGRFLGKVGLEYLALTSPSSAMAVELDPIRRYARFGSLNSIWPIYFGKTGQLNELREEKFSSTGGGWEIESEFYRFSLGQWQTGGYVFAFGMGTDLYAMDFTSNAPNDHMKSVVTECVLECVHYPPGTF
jgi:hypothetical protein